MSTFTPRSANLIELRNCSTLTAIPRSWPICSPSLNLKKLSLLNLLMMMVQIQALIINLPHLAFMNLNRINLKEWKFNLQWHLYLLVDLNQAPAIL